MPRPLIAVSTPIETLSTPFGDRDCTKLATAYTDAIYAAGGQPAIVPVTADPPPDLLARFDGLVLSGGGDLDPRLYGEEPDSSVYGIRPDRDTFEVALYHDAVARELPVLAICRGMQLVNVVHRGSLIQQIEDDTDHWQTIASHEAAHKIEISPDTRLAGVLGQAVARVNSYHHQALKDLGLGLRVAARCGAVIEAIEAEDAPVLAVQWHPEQMAATDQLQRSLFAAFVSTAAEYRNNTKQEMN
ncbi:gamma-glutamyl-gamma-aminobutyrate hydrolase family protein [Nocardia jiangxiensis]|uniref:gamma-glutamyl-gamma-aminobutyrate hydrolase family protein n=1 Tax=Nocardia jiangxiensis TaxID=282685 RepID=UPI000594DD84|nr:gamma-glutamyl-gamma-aminobutyrate hydrolase family protein [Nocardia jiangxiensis]